MSRVLLFYGAELYFLWRKLDLRISDNSGHLSTNVTTSSDNALTDRRVRMYNYSSREMDTLDRFGTFLTSLDEKQEANNEKTTPTTIDTLIVVVKYELEERGELVALLQLATHVTFVSSSESLFFKHCVANSVLLANYLDDHWPNNVHMTSMFFDVCGEETSAVVTCLNLDVPGSFDALTEHILSPSTPWPPTANSSLFIDKRRALSRIQLDASSSSSRSVNDVKSAMFNIRDEFKRRFRALSKRWCDQLLQQCIQQQTSRQAAREKRRAIVDEIVRTYLLIGGESKEERVIFNQVLCDANEQQQQHQFKSRQRQVDNKQHVTVCSLLMQVARDMLVELQQENAEEDNNNNNNDDATRLLCLLAMFYDQARHYIFRHHIFNDAHFIPLLLAMLELRAPAPHLHQVLRARATKLAYAFLHTDHIRYGSKLLDYDAKRREQTAQESSSSSSSVRTLYRVVLESLEFALAAATAEATNTAEVDETVNAKKHDNDGDQVPPAADGGDTFCSILN